MKNISQFNRFQLAITGGIFLFSIFFFVYKAVFSADIPYIKNDSQAQWIVHPHKFFLGIERSTKEFPVTTRFQKDLKFIKGVEQPVIHIKAHKQAVLFVNNIEITTTNPDYWKKETSVNLSEYLKAGQNQIKIEVTAFPSRGILYAYISGLPYHWGTDSSWYSEKNGTQLARAVVADDTRSDFYNFSQQTTFQHFNSLTPSVILIFLICSVIYFLAHNKIKSKHYSSLPKFFLLMIGFLWVFLFFKKMIHIPFQYGFDSYAHLAYTGYLLMHDSLPIPHNGWQFYQPPLFYIISALTIFLGKGIIPLEYHQIILKLLPFACGLGTVVAIYKLTKILFPDSSLKAIFIVLFAGSLPMNIYISAYYTNEILTSFLLNFAIILSLKIFVEEQAKPVQILFLSIVLGFALLTKYTALPVYIIIFAFIGLKLFFQQNSSYRYSIYCLFLLFLIPAIIAGWFYFRNYFNYGNFLASHPEFRQNSDIFGYWQYPGFHTLNYFLAFGEIFFKPIHAGVYSFWDGLYSTFWGDGFLGGQIANQHKFWNYSYMFSTYLVAFPVMFILLFGFLKSLVCAVRSEDVSQRIQDSFLVCLVCVAVVILFYKTLLFGDYSSTKSFYCLFLLTPLSIFFAQGMEQIYSLLSKRTMIIPRTIVSGWFGLLMVVIWLSFLM